jgi:Ca2+-binding RTX toxin-like protein
MKRGTIDARLEYVPRRRRLSPRTDMHPKGADVARKKSSSKARKGVFAGTLAAALLAFPGIANATVTSTVDAAGALTVESTAGEAITITCVNDQVQINNAPPGGPGDDACDAITSITVTGDNAANVINLAAVTAPIVTQTPDFPNVTDVTINGGGGNDEITGSEFPDTMSGGAGNDRIIGDDNAPNTRDVFRGDAGNDTLVWNGGHDDDLMDGDAGTDTIEVNGAPAAEAFTVNASATAGRQSFDRLPAPGPGAFNLDIGTSERLDLNANGGNDTLTAGGGFANLPLDVDGGDGDDVLEGTDAADLMSGGGGNDTITPDNNPAGTLDDARGDAGNDTIIWNGGDGDDLNEGGDGSDTSQVNGAGAPEEFTVKPSATAGRVRFDRVSNPPAPFFVDMGTTERLDLNASGGDDRLTTDPGFDALSIDVDGGDGNDVLDGGDAADLLTGGLGNDQLTGDNNPANTRDESRGDAGDDLMIWNPGDGSDLNEGGDGNDTAEVNGGDADERFTVKPSATAGRVQFDRVDPGPFNIDIGTTETMLVDAAGGNDRIKGSKGLAGLIAGTFNGDAGNDRVKGTDGEDSLSGGDGRDILRARDKAEDLVDCGAGRDIAFVDRRDFVRGCNAVFGGERKVKVRSKVLNAAGGKVALKLLCVNAKRCKGKATVRSNGKVLAKAKFKIKRRSPETVQLKMNSRGRRLMAGGSGKARKVNLRIVARDGDGNGWTTNLKRKMR